MNPNQNWEWDCQQKRFFPVTGAGQARIPLQPHGGMFGGADPPSFQGNRGGNRGGHLSQRGNNSQGQRRGGHHGTRGEDNFGSMGGNIVSHHYDAHHGSMNSILGLPPDIRSSVPSNLNFNPNQSRGRGTGIRSATADNYRHENWISGALQTQDPSASMPLSMSGEREASGENKFRQNQRRGNFHGRRGRGRRGKRGQDRRRGGNVGAVGGERTTEVGSQCGSGEDDESEEGSDFEQSGTDTSSGQGTENYSIYGRNNTIDTMTSKQTKDNTIAGAEGIKNLGLKTLYNRMRRYKAKLDALKIEGNNAKALEMRAFFESVIEQIDTEIKSRSSDMKYVPPFVERPEKKPRKRRPRKRKSDYKNNDRTAAAESPQPARDPTVSDSDDSSSFSDSETEESFQQLPQKNGKSNKVVEDLLSKIKDLGDQVADLKVSKSDLQEDSISYSSDTTKGSKARSPGFRTSTDSLTKEKTFRRKSTQEESNESECGESPDLPNENKVFEYFIKEVGGPTSLRNIVDKNLFPKDFDITKWFLSHQRRFILFKTDEKIHFIVPFYKEATFCLDYNGLGKFKTCEKSNCPHAHVCKDFIGGSCKEGPKCRFSHNFNDRANAGLISQLGLDIFCNEEIRLIYSQRFPHVCGSHNLNHICRRPVCAYIHICKRSLWGRCEKGSDCTLSHSLETEQNKNVLKAYHLSHWKEPLLRKVIFIYTSASKGYVPQKDNSPYGSKESIPEKRNMSQNMLNRATESRGSFQKLQETKPDSGGKSSDCRKGYTRSSSSPSPERFGKHNGGRNGSFNKDRTNNETEEAAKDSPWKRDFQQERKENEDESIKYVPPSRRAGSRKPKSASPDTDIGGTEQKGPKSRHGSSHEENKMSIDSVLETDAAQSTPICDRYLVDKCKMATCKFHHVASIKLPYIWQIQMFQSWLTLDKLQMIEVERAYCNKESTCQAVVFFNGSNFIATLEFHTPDSLSAIVASDGGKSSFKIETSVRRLSTKSYAEGTKPSSEDSFKTQWRWFYMDDLGSWDLLEPEFLQFTLEQKFTSKCQDTYLFCRHNYRFKYRIDFKSMEQINIETGKKRKLMRRPLFVSEEDVVSKHYPKKISTPTGVAIPLPKEWVPWDQAHDFELVELKQDSVELKRVESLFFSTLQPQEFRISYICRVQNMKLWRAYDEQKQSMKISLERAGQTKEVDERSLFHGTDSLDTVRGICTNSFDFRVCGKHGTVYGKGAYFARDAKYSHSYTNSSSIAADRYMFLAKVLVGEYTTGSPSYTRPPDKPGATAHQLFDSCVDNVNNPAIFVVFDLKQCYPEYLVCYKKVEELPVREATLVRPNKNVTPYPRAQIQPSTLQNASVQPTSGIHKSSSSAETSLHRSAPTTGSFSDNISSRPVSVPSYSPPLSPRRSSDTTGSQTLYQRQEQRLNDVEARANQARHSVRDPSTKQETCCLQ